VVRFRSTQTTTAVGRRNVRVPRGTGSPRTDTDCAVEYSCWIGGVLIGCWALTTMASEEKA
jgi:hypothetical protein